MDNLLASSRISNKVIVKYVLSKIYICNCPCYTALLR